MTNSTPTPPLIQQQSTDDKVGLMLGQGRGRCAVVQTLTWISFFSILVFFSSIHFPHLIFRTRLEQGIEQLKSKLQEAK